MWSRTDVLTSLTGNRKESTRHGSGGNMDSIEDRVHRAHSEHAQAASGCTPTGLVTAIASGSEKHAGRTHAQSSADSHQRGTDDLRGSSQPKTIEICTVCEQP